MKKLALLTFCFIATMAMTAEAQNSYVGLRGGLNYSNFTGDDNSDATSYKLGYHVGAFYHMGITENLGFQPEILYSRKGYEAESSSTEDILGSSTRTDYKKNTALSYIDVPLLFVFTLGGNYGLQVLAGPSVGYITGQTTKTEISKETKMGGNTITSSSESEDDNMSDINTLQLGVTGGLGYLTEGGFGIQGRVDYGISKIFDNDEVDIKNINYMLSLSWALGN